MPWRPRARWRARQARCLGWRCPPGGAGWPDPGWRPGQGWRLTAMYCHSLHYTSRGGCPPCKGIAPITTRMPGGWPSLPARHRTCRRRRLHPRPRQLRMRPSLPHSQGGPPCTRRWSVGGVLGVSRQNGRQLPAVAGGACCRPPPRQVGGRARHSPPLAPAGMCSPLAGRPRPPLPPSQCALVLLQSARRWREPCRQRWTGALDRGN